MTTHDKFDALKKEAEQMLRSVASEAKRLSAIGSHKLSISTLNGEIRDYQSEIGAWVCEHRDILPEDADIAPLLGKIDSLKAEAAEHRQAVSQLIKAANGAPAEDDADTA